MVTILDLLKQELSTRKQHGEDIALLPEIIAEITALKSQSRQLKMERDEAIYRESITRSRTMPPGEMSDIISALKRENEKLKEALGFYANKDNWVGSWGVYAEINDLDREEIKPPWADKCGGKRARQTLNEIK